MGNIQNKNEDIPLQIADFLVFLGILAVIAIAAWNGLSH